MVLSSVEYKIHLEKPRINIINEQVQRALRERNEYTRAPPKIEL